MSDVLGPSGISRDELAGSSTGLSRPRFATVKRFRARKARRSSPPRGGAERFVADFPGNHKPTFEVFFVLLSFLDLLDSETGRPGR